MPSYKKSISDLARLRNENDNAIRNQLERLGGQIAELDDDVLQDTEFAPAAGRIKELEESIRQKAHTIESWNELSDELETIDDAIKQIDFEIAAKVGEIEPYLESIGEAALDTYLSDPDTYGAVAEAVEPLVTIEEGIRTKERELQNLESTDRPDSFLGKTFARGKGLVLRGALRTRGMQRSRALRGAGERICDLESHDAFKDESALSKALVPAMRSLEEKQKLRKERSKLEKNRDDVQQNRLEIEKREGMRNPVKNLGHEIERLRGQIAEISTELGDLCMQNVGSMADVEADIQSSIDFITQVQNENKSASKLIDRLNAALDVDRLSDEIEAKKTQRANLEAEIEALDASVERIKSEKTTRSKARGSLASLDEGVQAILKQQDE